MFQTKESLLVNLNINSLKINLVILKTNWNLFKLYCFKDLKLRLELYFLQRFQEKNLVLKYKIYVMNLIKIKEN